MPIGRREYNCMHFRAALSFIAMQLGHTYSWLISLVIYLSQSIIHHHDNPGTQDRDRNMVNRMTNTNLPPSPSSEFANSFPDFSATYDSSHVHEAFNATSPTMLLFHGKKLGKEVLGFAVTMTTGLLFNQSQSLKHLEARWIAIALCLGFTTTWNGLLLRGMYPRIASAMENFGVTFVFVAFYGLVSSCLPPGLKWAPWLCCGLSCLPLILGLLPLISAKETGQPNSALRSDQ